MHWGVRWGARKIHDLDGAHFDLQCAVVLVAGSLPAWVTGRTIPGSVSSWCSEELGIRSILLQALLADPDNVQSLYLVAAGHCCGWMALPGGDSRPKAYWVITHSGQKPHSMPFTAA